MNAIAAPVEERSPKPAEARVFFTVAQLTKRWSLGRSKIYEMMDSGQIPSVKIGSARRIFIESVLEFEARLAATGTI